jgi:GNAT superfamily N-acetyltransferase
VNPESPQRVDLAAALRVTKSEPEHGPLLSALFARADVACHCRYWHFSGNTNAWLDRCAHGVDVSRAEMTAALDAGADEMLGVVALEREAIVGWLKLSPAASVPKLYEQRIYRKLPCFDAPRDGVLTIGCLLVDPAARKRGVGTALLTGAIALGRTRGASAIEAFPRRAEGTRDEEVWTGPFSLFARAGFEVVHDFAPYPVLRLPLTR